MKRTITLSNFTPARYNFVQELSTRNENAPTGISLSFSNSGYSQLGADHTRSIYKRFNAFSSSPTRDILTARRTLMSRSRVLYMSAPLATSAIDTMAQNVVGSGLRLHMQPDYKTLGIDKEEAKEWARKVEAEFDLWASDKQQADALGLANFYEMQHQAFSSQKQNGDQFVVFRQGQAQFMRPYTLRLQLIESDRVCSPTTAGDGKYVGYVVQGLNTLENKETGTKIYDGVEVDKSGHVVAYHISSCYPQEGFDVQFERIAAIGRTTGRPNILHLMTTERPEQLRGVPMLAKVIEPVLQLTRYMNSEVQAAVMGNYFTVYITSPTSDAALMGNTAISSSNFVDDGTGEEEGETGASLKLESDKEEDLDLEEETTEERCARLEPYPGAVYQLKEGEEPKAVAPTHPNAQFEAFTNCAASYIGAALKTPRDVLTKSYNGSYSASRAAMIDYWRVVEMERSWLNADLNDPVFEEWFNEAVARGRVSAPGLYSDPLIYRAWMRHEWVGTSMPHIDPVKEVQAMQLQVQNHFLTHKQATTKLNGGDWDRNAAEAENEAEQMRRIEEILPTKKTDVKETPEEEKEETETDHEQQESTTI